MRRIMILFLAVLIAACSSLPPGEYDVYPKITGVQSQVYTHSDENVSWKAYVHSGPLATFTPYPTYTLRPTYTPYPTNTPYATNEFHTPTPESTGTPTFVPPPTLPPLASCSMKVNRNINVRNDHSTSGTTVLRAQASGTTITVSEFFNAAQFLWGKIGTNQWLVVRDNLQPTWWADGAGPDWEQCERVKGWPLGLDPPGPIAVAPIFAFHGVPGANVNEMIEAGRVLLAADIPFRR